jgi:hypothetical protein
MITPIFSCNGSRTTAHFMTDVAECFSAHASAFIWQ